ncbi:MAG: hypothetical protein LBQ83_00995 [Candidatus Margulisbacteria bacterium]|jgi:hypothetical protein|nr:hypothetical protein [Candidatus Margulisiibacteriota bacterium]
MPGLLSSVDERIPFDINRRKAAGIRSREESLYDMISLTVKSLADKSSKTVEAFLNNHSINELAGAIQQYGRREEDIIPIINLVVEHTQDIIQKYNQDGKDLNFPELLELKKKFPAKSAVLLVSYALAKRDPRLTAFAGTVLSEEKAPSVTDMFVRFSPVKAQIQYTGAAEYASAAYSRTKQGDQAAQKYRAKKIQESKAETLKQQEKRLANLEITAGLDPFCNAGFVQAKLKSTLIVRT